MIVGILLFLSRRSAGLRVFAWRQRKLKIRQDFEAQKGHSHTCVVPKTQATWIATARIDWLQAQECPSLMVDRENISQNLSLWRLSPFSGHLKFSDQPKSDARIIYRNPQLLKLPTLPWFSAKIPKKRTPIWLMIAIDYIIIYIYIS